MKKLLLTSLFASYYFFMPFVWVNCAGSDQPYVAAEASVTDDDLLAECLTQEFLTEDCAALVQKSEEEQASREAAVAAAKIELNDFSACYSYQAAEAPTDTTTETADCATVAADVIDGYEACTMSAEDIADCDDVTDGLSDALGLCAAHDASVSEDFCALIES